MFIDQSRFDFVAPLQAEWQAIREECLALPHEVYEPWVQREMYGEGWSVYGLHAFGERIDAALQECPRTAAALERIPGLTTAGFSRLAGGAHIRPHVGWVHTVFRAHLGLVVPERCELRVGEQTRCWREGECLIFDDTMEHEAWNRSVQARVVLLFDFRRPGLESAQDDVAPREVQRFLRGKLRS